ncbi:hypothetical protein [Desulfoluna sp.]|uniref:hypothetical protein n=1 Tax=Desulfoluna sp. TaxID=2045199 RepID=UPI00260F5770|nr:hypothetical protein [Desulfoluna sp.]
MDQKIFTLHLPTETVSCYLLLTGLADQALPLNRETVATLWTGEPGALETALEELHRQGIIGIPETPNTPLRLLPSEMWGN